VNAVFSPLFTLIIILGFFLCPASFLGEAIGGFFSVLVYVPTHLFLEAAQWLSKMPVFASRGPLFSVEETIVYYIGLAVVFCGLLWRKKIMIWIFKNRLSIFFRRVSLRGAYSLKRRRSNLIGEAVEEITSPSARNDNSGNYV
jgi:hypothetical protein